MPNNRAHRRNRHRPHRPANKCEKPMPWVFAQSSIAAISAPDCATNAISPTFASVDAKLAFNPMPGTSRPKQFGPNTRSRLGRAAANIASVRLWPSVALALDNPALNTTAALVPTVPSSVTSDGTVAAGVHITVRSGDVGKAATDGNARRPATVDRRLLTGQTGPLNAPANRFLITVAPTLCGRSEAPITATDLGQNKCSRLRTDIVDDRKSTSEASFSPAIWVHN